jgi:radical SAM enzyme (TIGR01210 family)
MPKRHGPARKRYDDRHVSPSSPAAVWKEPARLRNETVQAGVVILRTTGCAHWHAGGCSMCGYNAESAEIIQPSDISMQFERVTERFEGISMLKVYTSGSFLDESEIAPEVAEKVLRFAKDSGVRLLLESRPEFVTEKKLGAMLGIYEDIEVAIGLESANDRILKYSINKGFTLKDYERAASVLNRLRIPLRTYVLLKPPFLTEAEAMEDAISTVRLASEHSETVSLNPVNVQKGTPVERLWRQWAYRPPWLWTVLEVLRETSSVDADVICDPTGGGKERGAHNCGLCDSQVLAAVKRYSETQNPAELAPTECSCRSSWEAALEIEGLALGGTYDLQRFFRRRDIGHGT